MNIRWLLAASLVLTFATNGAAQTGWQFRWQKGQILNYKVKHHTDVAEVVEKIKIQSTSKLDLTKRWQVTDVDNQGVATLEFSLVAMRNEQKRTNGDVLLFDSEDPQKSTPELREQMSKFIGKTLAILRVDRYGRVLETKLGSASRYEAEPPFVVVFPDAKPEAGQGWRRPYNIVMEPPQGTGEKYKAEQLYDCKKIDAGKATIALTTEFKTMPETVLERLPLLQKDMQGTLTFDIDGGRLTAVRMNIEKTIENHQGKGSTYRFQSEYSETLVE